jgi:hypothetical protein
MENNRQSGRVFAIGCNSVRGLLAPSSFLASCLNRILAVIVVAIGRISLNLETG